MNKRNLLLSLVVGCMFMFTEVQAAVNVDSLAQCMAQCKGNKSCVDSCVSSSAPRGATKEALQCLAGCGIGVTSQASGASLKEQIKACCEGCLKAMN